VVLGVLGSPSGPFWGLVVLWLADAPRALAVQWGFLVGGARAAGSPTPAPGGLYGLLQRWRPLQFFPVRRRLVSDRGEEE
jgi:hypothetical protein